jgi:hypothetical protein
MNVSDTLAAWRTQPDRRFSGSDVEVARKSGHQESNPVAGTASGACWEIMRSSQHETSGYR